MPGQASQQLQQIFKVLSDPTRMRILRLLSREELMVQEVMGVLGMAQSRISRHLAILRDAGLVSDRRDGTYVFYRFIPPAEGLWRMGWNVVQAGLDQDPTANRDDTMLRSVVEARSTQARNFFDAVGPEWDALRKVFNDDILRARALNHMTPRGFRVADIGTGTGILASELARLGLDVVGIDRSAAMLDAAREKIQQESFPPGGSVELRRGEANRIPLDDAEMDAAFAHMVLHYVPSPAEVISEMTRILRPGGVLVVVDFVQHELDWMAQELGVLWMGFEPDEVRHWLSSAGLSDILIEENQSESGDRALPATFIASARAEESVTP